MKLYKENKSNICYYDKIKNNNLTCIYHDSYTVDFYKNGKLHNDKNVALISKSGYKSFYLNGKHYRNNFTKKSWRKFVKLQTFI
jgi:ATP sulfurylase